MAAYAPESAGRGRVAIRAKTDDTTGLNLRTAALGVLSVGGFWGFEGLLRAVRMTARPICSGPKVANGSHKSSRRRTQRSSLARGTAELRLLRWAASVSTRSAREHHIPAHVCAHLHAHTLRPRPKTQRDRAWDTCEKQALEAHPGEGRVRERERALVAPRRGRLHGQRGQTSRMQRRKADRNGAASFST